MHVIYTEERNSEHLSEYIKLRKFLCEALTEKYYGFLSRGETDIYDDLSNPHMHLYLAIAENGECLGGTRLIMRKADETFLLPSENQEFSFDKILPADAPAKPVVAEISRLAIHPNHPFIMKDFADYFYKKGVALGVDYLVGVTSMTRARIFKMHSRPYSLCPLVINKTVTYHDEYTDKVSKHGFYIDFTKEKAVRQTAVQKSKSFIYGQNGLPVPVLAS